VEELHPPAVLMENVFGLAVRNRGKYLRAVEDRLQDTGYRVWTKVLRAADFGVPQWRKRLFVVAFDKDLKLDYQFPELTAPQRSLPTVWDAIGDLPSLANGGTSRRYSRVPRTQLQQYLRGRCERLTWHEAPKNSDGILSVLKALRGDGASRDSIDDPDQPSSGFHNTYCRLRSGEPAPAVTSAIGRISSGRHAHPFDDRALTPREAARLQTFRDSYVWKGNRWFVYEQIGNAVPPSLATAVAKSLIDTLAPVLSCLPDMALRDGGNEISVCPTSPGGPWTSSGFPQ
jgi:DNA (cytosine-5)-methyltransferase 1